MPVVRLGQRIPRPVRNLEVLEDDSRILIFLRRVAPDIEVPVGAARFRQPRSLKPGMLIGRGVDDQFGDHPQPTRMRFANEDLEIPHRAVRRIDLRVAGDVVTVILERRGIEWQQPERRDTQVLQVIELLRQPSKVADAVSVAVEERTHVQLINHRVLVPLRIARKRRGLIRRRGGACCLDHGASRELLKFVFRGPDGKHDGRVPGHEPLLDVERRRA